MQFKSIRLKNINRVIIGNLNINSLPVFPTSQFMVDGFSMPYRQDRNRNGGGIMIYIRDDIPSILLTKHVFPDDIEGLFVELNFRKSKWLLMGAYHPPSQSNSYFFEHLDKALDIYSNYEKVLQEISTQKLQSLVWIPSYINMT